MMRDTIIIRGDRRSGKTTELIKLSAKTGRTIVCPTPTMAHYVQGMAKDMGKKIPAPIGIHDLLHGKMRGRRDLDRAYIDELIMCMEVLLGGGVDIKYATTRHDVWDMENIKKWEEERKW